MASARGDGWTGWEHKVLAVLAYPANLAFVGVAAFLLALPVVTWFSALVAAGRAQHRWLADGDDRTWTTTFREFGATWRRTLPASVAATVVAAVLALNVIFLGTRDTPVAFLFGMATVPFAAAFALIIVMLPVAAATEPDASMRAWLRQAVTLAVRRPLASAMLLVIVTAFAATCLVLPTIVPFFGMSVPIWLAIATTGVLRGPRV